RLALLDELDARVGAEAPAHLGGGASVRHDDVGREVVLAADQGRTDAVGVDRNAAALELTDPLRVEATGSDDLHLLEPVPVERLPHLPDEPLVDAARLEV